MTSSVYDFESVMHYQNNINNGRCGKKITLNPTCAGPSTAIRRPDNGLSKYDVAKIHMLYRNEVTPPIPRIFVNPESGC